VCECTEKRVLRRIFGFRREEVMGAGKNCAVKSFTVSTLHETLLG
jgi:hypothetical protein